MRFQSVTQLFAALVLAFSATSCSKSNTQTVTINFPDWKQLQAATYAQQAQSSSPSASATLENAGIISVSVGNRVIPGFPWEHKGSQPNPPTNVTFEVENGSLVQAMAILETAGGARAYYYGDAKVTQSGALDIELTNVLTTTAGEGKIIGRYITGTDSSGKPVGPTGVFQYRFDIASLRADLADRPAMVVTTGEIFNGWMSVTTLAETALKYSKFDGSPIFESSAIDVATVAVGTTRAARVVVPAGFKNENSGSTYDMRESPRKQYLLGYFGPSADAYALSVPGGLNLCYESVSSFGTAPTIDRLYRQLAASGSTSEMPQGQMVWGGEFPGLSYTEKLVTARLAAGGIVKTSAACIDSALALNQALTIDSRNLSSDDEFMGFRGPFAKLASDRFVASTYSPANQKVTVNWSLLPGVPSVLSGVSVFYRSVASGSNDDDAIKTMDGYDCQSMRDRSRGFEDFKEIQSTTLTAEITGIPNQTDADKLQIIACPRALDGSVYKSAVRVEQGYSNPSLDSLRISGPVNVPVGVPVAYLVELTASGGPKSASTNLAVNLSTNGSGTFHVSNSCVSAVVSGATIVSGSSSVQVYFCPAGPGFVNLTAAALSVTGGVASAVVGYASTPTSIRVALPATALAVGYCYPLDLTLMNGSDPANNANLAYNITAPNAGELFINQTCSSAFAGPINFASNEFRKTLFYKPAAVLMSANVAATITPSGSPSFGQTTSFSANSAVPTTFAFIKQDAAYQSTRWFAPNECFNAILQPRSANGADVRVTAPTIRVVTSLSGLEFGCSTGSLSKSVAMASAVEGNGASSPFEIRILGNPLSVSVSVPNGTFSPDTTTLYAQPVVTIKDANGASSPVALVPGMCQELKVHLQKPTDLTNYNLPIALDARIQLSTGTVYSGLSCTGQLPDQTLAMSPVNYLGSFYMRPNMPTTVTVHPVTGQASVVANTQLLSAVGRFNTPFVSSGLSECVPVDIQTSLPAPVSLTWELTVENSSALIPNSLGGFFFNELTCGNSTSSAVAPVSQTISHGPGLQASSSLWVKMGSSNLSGRFRIRAVAQQTLSQFVAVIQPSSCTSTTCNQ